MGFVFMSVVLNSETMGEAKSHKWMMNRWSEAGKGQVRKRNGKTLEGGKNTQREELKSKQ